VRSSSAWGRPSCSGWRSSVTGAHSAHLVAGLLLVAWIQVRAWFGVYSQRRHLGVQMAAIYWYFVVAVQLAIFVSLYLTPRI